MTNAYHATQLANASRHCPRVLDYQRDKIPTDRTIFQAGIAAHAVLDRVGQRANQEGRILTDIEVRDVAQSVTLELISHGRSFDKVPEPPLIAERAFEGRDLACEWLATFPIEPGSSYELGLAIDATGRNVPYWSEDARVRAILDKVTVRTEEDEESSRTVVSVLDYKSSWAADDSELDTLQRKTQAVVAWRAFGEPVGADILRLEVANLRLQKVYSRELWAQDDLRATLASWTRDILSTCAALDEMERLGKGKRPAIPGRGCNGCSFLFKCPEAMNYHHERGEFQSSEKRATAYAVATAMCEQLAESLRLETEEGPIEIEGGVVGTVAQERRELTPDAHELLAEAWQEGGGEIVGFAKALELSTRNAEKMARALFYDRMMKGDRDALVKSVTQTTHVRTFGIHPKQATAAKGESE